MEHSPSTPNALTPGSPLKSNDCVSSAGGTTTQAAEDEWAGEHAGASGSSTPSTAERFADLWSASPPNRNPGTSSANCWDREGGRTRGRGSPATSATTGHTRQQQEADSQRGPLNTAAERSREDWSCDRKRQQVGLDECGCASN